MRCSMHPPLLTECKECCGINKPIVVDGLAVEFPFTPYASQVEVMEMAIRALRQGQHALLESPTGSGKSLALLCSALAWQRAQRSNQAGKAADMSSCVPTLGCSQQLAGLDGEAEVKELQCVVEDPDYLGRDTAEACADEGELCLPSHPLEPVCKEEACEDAPSKKKKRGKDGSDADSDQGFLEFVRCHNQRLKSVLRAPAPSAAGRKKQPVHPEKSPGVSRKRARTRPALFAVEQPPACCGTAGGAGVAKDLDVPRIFFLTRTHAQIKQLVRELSKTRYRPTMDILASRHRLCINNKVLGAV
eukprot:RCo004286